MRTTSVFLTLAYCAAVVMGAPTPTKSAHAASSSSAVEAPTNSSSSEAAFTTLVEGGVRTYTHCNRPGVFALTFDDGPDKYSWGLAKTLQAEGIKATFFINGNNSVDVLNASTNTTDGMKTYIEVIKQYYDAGHEVASHTLEHKNLVGMTEEEVKRQMNEQSDIIFKAIGKRPALMRPPEGVVDAVSSRVLQELGYHNILWDVDTKDWEHKGLASEQHLVKAIMDKDVANKTLGHIGLEHDIHEDTVKTLVPWITKYVKDKGLTFVTVSDCIGVAPYQNDGNSTTTTNTTTTATVGASQVAALSPVDSASHVDIDLSGAVVAAPQ